MEVVVLLFLKLTLSYVTGLKVNYQKLETDIAQFGRLKIHNTEANTCKLNLVARQPKRLSQFIVRPIIFSEYIAF